MNARDHSGMATGVSVHNIGAIGDKMIATFSTGQTCQPNPAVTLVDRRVSGGCDLDGFLDAGERVTLDVTLRNQPTAAPTSGVQATLVSLSPNVTVVNGSASYPNLGHGEFGDAIVPFQIQASASAPCAPWLLPKYFCAACSDSVAAPPCSRCTWTSIAVSAAALIRWVTPLYST